VKIIPPIEGGVAPRELEGPQAPEDGRGVSEGHASCGAERTKSPRHPRSTRQPGGGVPTRAHGQVPDRGGEAPFRKAIDEYNFSYPSRINKQNILDLFDLLFIEHRSNVVFIGPTGVGKTHLSVALAFAACEANVSVRFTPAMGMVNQLTAAPADNTFVPKVEQYTRPRVLVIDELGYLPIDRKGAVLHDTRSLVHQVRKPNHCSRASGTSSPQVFRFHNTSSGSKWPFRF
jgi:hypothetical protein